MLKGIIVINAFLRPKESVAQAERLKSEFESRGVEVQIISDGFIKSAIVGDKPVTDFFDVNFCVYLDKDKYLSQMLEKVGIRLFNSHKAIRVCDDKAETYLALSGAGIRIPDTLFGFLSYSEEDAIPDGYVDGVIKKLSLPLIVKESYGSMGKGVYLANSRTELRRLMEKLKNKPHLYQKLIGDGKGKDLRVIVIGGKAVAYYERKNDGDFRSNIGIGGVGRKIPVPKKFIAAAENCAKLIGLDYCGVDILYDGTSPVVCEVNSNAFFKEAEKVTGVNIAALYADHVIKIMTKGV